MKPIIAYFKKYPLAALILGAVIVAVVWKQMEARKQAKADKAAAAAKAAATPQLPQPQTPAPISGGGGGGGGYTPEPYEEPQLAPPTPPVVPQQGMPQPQAPQIAPIVKMPVVSTTPTAGGLNPIKGYIAPIVPMASLLEPKSRQ